MQIAACDSCRPLLRGWIRSRFSHNYERSDRLTPPNIYAPGSIAATRKIPVTYPGYAIAIAPTSKTRTFGARALV
jgi:hypothetical protein